MPAPPRHRIQRYPDAAASLGEPEAARLRAAGRALSVLRAVLAPVLADLAASGVSPPDIREEAHEDREESVCAWIQGPGITGEGISVILDRSPAEQVAELAERFRGWAADEQVAAGRAPDWPACPLHPGSHGLGADVRDGSAVWCCTVNDTVICAIGALPGRPAGKRRRR